MRYKRSRAVTLVVAVCAGQGAADLCADRASSTSMPASGPISMWGTPGARNAIIAIPTVAQGFTGRAK